MIHGTRLLLVGQAADFKMDASETGPDWEHLALLRSGECAATTLDAARSRSRLLANRPMDAGLVWRLAWQLRRVSDIMAQSEPSGYPVALALAASLSRSRLSIIFHGHEWWGRRNRAFAAVCRRMRRVQFLCLSTALRDLVVREYAIDPTRARVTGYGVDARYFVPEDATEPPCVVSAGTASRDYRTLAEASLGLETEVRIAAASNWYNEALNVAPEQVPGNVHIFSAGDYAGLRALYRRAAFVVVPMRDVTFACGYAVIAEAMAMGKAVIATRTRAPSDLIADGVSGLYVPPGDPGALRAAMQRLLADPGLAQAMGREGRARVEREFSLDAYVGRLRQATGLDG